jgi:triacylglycerol esterase/lipase EstA (alpha/beta hydrolase family)
MTLIAHSQGGILAKLYVLKQLMNGHGGTLLVDLIITLGTPHRGRLLLNPLLWCQNIPYVRGLLPFRQLGQLASWSRNIRTLRKHWTDTHISQTPCSPTAKRRYIRSIAVIGAFDRWVSAKSAAGFSVDSREYLSLGHPALAKPGSRTEHLAQLILDQLREHHYPGAILDSIRRIRAEAREHQRYVRNYTGMIGSLVRLARPGLGKTGIEIKTASLLNDFLDDFPRRPLRNLVLDTALKTYAERQLGDEV